MDAVFRSLGGSPSPPPASPLDETINVRNELREMAAKVTTGKKKQATVRFAAWRKRVEHKTYSGYDVLVGHFMMVSGESPEADIHSTGNSDRTFHSTGKTLSRSAGEEMYKLAGMGLDGIAEI